jgi:RNA polymerase sigma-70 factor, ECF subfamily
MPDLQEFTRVVRENHHGLRYFIQGLGVNPAWVDDIAQDSFLVAYRKWDELDKVENPGAWLRAIARNLVMNELAKLNRRQRLLDENLTQLLLEAPDRAPIAGEFSDLSHQRDALGQCLDLLTVRTREVIDARYFADLNASQIGERLSLTPSAVRKILFHARQSLADCLKARNITPAT